MKPDPKEIRELKNDKAHAHRYADREEPKPSSKKAQPPEFLSERGKEIFIEIVERIEEMYPCSETDSYALSLYAQNQEQYEYLDNYLRVWGVTYEETKFVKTGRDTGVETTSIKKRPEVEIHKQCKDFALKVLTEFGLTPSSRTRVNLKKKPDAPKANPFGQLRSVK